MDQHVPEPGVIKDCFDVTIRMNDIYISDGTPPNIYVNDIIVKNNDGTDENSGNPDGSTTHDIG